MSATTTRLPLSMAEDVASRLLDRLDSCYERLEIAGSIRRRQSSVGDVEIVAVPRVVDWVERDMFDQVVGTVSIDQLDARLVTLLEADVVSMATDPKGRAFWGPKAKRLVFEGVQVDLFTPSADRYGLILAIRTGPRQYSNQLVTPRGGLTHDGRPGLLPPIYRVRDGYLRYRVSGEPIATTEEVDLFERLELPYPEPWERR